MRTTRRTKKVGINHWNESVKIQELNKVLRYNQKSNALISPCGHYRYQLERVWDNSKPKVMFIMLNPSNADSTLNDPTIKRCIAFAASWGYGGLMVGNLFAYRATNPAQLFQALDPVGPDNLSHLRWMAYQCEAIVFAWGNSPVIKKLQTRPQIDFIKSLKLKKYSIHRNLDGSPKHPLYISLKTTPDLYDQQSDLFKNL